MLKKLLVEIEVRHDETLKEAQLVGQIRTLLCQTFGSQTEAEICFIQSAEVETNIDDRSEGSLSETRCYDRFSVGNLTFTIRGGTAVNHDFLTRCLSIIVEHIEDDEFNQLRFAEMLNLSKPTFYRKIKNITGLSAKDFITGVKMQIAYQLLETRKYTVSEVAWRCGYNSVRYFSKKFHDAFKQYPSKIQPFVIL